MPEDPEPTQEPTQDIPQDVAPPVAEVEAVPATLSAQAHLALQEVEVFWANILANVSDKVETPIHNFILAETEALKARISALI